MTRQEKAAQAQALRDQGLMWKEIAQIMGLSVSAVHEYATDPDGTRAHARRHKADGVCIDCGATTHSGGANPPERCRKCNYAYSREVSRRYVLESINEWGERFGVPPAASDWNPAMARERGFHDRTERYEKTGRPWPTVALAQAIFGSWNAAIEAAGWEPRPAGCYGRDGELDDVCEDTARRYLAGTSAYQIAKEDGISWEAVRHRLLKMGVTLRNREEARELRRAA
jgi:hypothetical protein